MAGQKLSLHLILPCQNGQQADQVQSQSSPHLRDPAAPWGPTCTSVTQWLHNTPDDTWAVSENILPDQLPSETTMKSPPVRIIVAEPDETAAIMDNNNVDEMGVEDLEGTDTNNDSEYCNNACMECGRKGLQR